MVQHERKKKNPIDHGVIKHCTCQLEFFHVMGDVMPRKFHPRKSSIFRMLYVKVVRKAVQHNVYSNYSVQFLGEGPLRFGEA